MFLFAWGHTGLHVEAGGSAEGLLQLRAGLRRRDLHRRGARYDFLDAPLLRHPQDRGFQSLTSQMIRKIIGKTDDNNNNRRRRRRRKDAGNNSSCIH